MYQDQKLLTTPGALITCNWPKAPFRKIRNLLKSFRYHSVQIFFTDLMTNVNLLDLVRLYIDRMIEDCGPCIKGIVMDKETVCDQKQTSRIISLSLLSSRQQLLAWSILHRICFKKKCLFSNVSIARERNNWNISQLSVSSDPLQRILKH